MSEWEQRKLREDIAAAADRVADTWYGCARITCEESVLPQDLTEAEIAAAADRAARDLAQFVMAMDPINEADSNLVDAPDPQNLKR